MREPANPTTTVSGAIILECVAETLPVTIAAATALGLVLMELISNSYKHAIPNHSGSIAVRVVHGKTLNEGSATITDDGVGYLPQAETRRHGVGLARRLMQQVEGTLDVFCENGTVWTLHFPVLVDVDTAAV